MATIRMQAAASAADRVCRVLLLLTVAGDRGILIEDLIAQSGASRPTVYRDIERIKRAGWRLDVESGEGRATYSLGAWQKVPKLGRGKGKR